MSNIYLVALLVSNASGHVDSIQTVDAATQGGCTNMARMVHVNGQPAPAGYEIKFNCGSREALDSVLAEHNCRKIGNEEKQGIVTNKYKCEPTIKNKVSGWVKSVF